MIWDMVISMMTEEEFWDKFQKRHNAKFYEKLKKILEEYSPLLQEVTTDDVKEKVKEKRLPRLKKVSLPS